MTPLKLLTARQWAKLLKKLGFTPARQKGSHLVYSHPDGRRTVIPQHGNRIISRTLTGEILRQIRLEQSSYSEIVEKL